MAEFLRLCAAAKNKGEISGPKQKRPSGFLEGHWLLLVAGGATTFTERNCGSNYLIGLPALFAVCLGRCRGKIGRIQLVRQPDAAELPAVNSASFPL